VRERRAFCVSANLSNICQTWSADPSVLNTEC
jgi:hypothetical protein